MKLCSLILVLTVAAIPAASAAKSYDGYKVLRVNVDDEATGHFLHDVGDTLGLDFWSELRVNAPVDVMVSPQNLDRLYHALGEYVCFLSRGSAIPYSMNQI